MVFAHLELARQLERPEAGARFVEARRRLWPDGGAQWIEVAGAYAMFDRPASPMTQTLGLGLFAETIAADLDRIESFFPGTRRSSLSRSEPPRRRASRGSVMYKPLMHSCGFARSTQSAPTNASYGGRLLAIARFFRRA
jgi:hypothetical protein